MNGPGDSDIERSPEHEDPLWLHSPVKRKIFRAGCYALPVAFLSLVVGGVSGSRWGLLAGAAVGGVLVLSLRGWVWDLLSRLRQGERAFRYRKLQGRHYSFGGIALDIHDDGQHCWIDEASVRRLLHLQRDPDGAFKARFTGQWREGAELGLAGPRRARGPRLWIKVSALHQHLASAPERLDPRRLRLRSYLERQVLYPAQLRRTRKG